jgi:NAD(P)-dependent dehydrogenase (short-subunit alcohol dehydrogenase family)
MSEAMFDEGAAMIFGGSGGVGQGVCREFAKAGANVAITYHKNREGAEALAAELMGLGVKASAHQVTISDAPRVEAAIGEVAKTYGRIHSIVIGVGTYVGQRMIADATREEWNSVIEEDLKGFLNILYSSLPRFREQGGGAYVHLGSAGHDWWPEADAMSVAPKAAIESLLQGIAREEGRNGIRANSVLLGVIEAGMFKVQWDKGIFPQAWVDEVHKALAIKRWGTPAEIGHATVFLASNKSAYITGQRISVSGGFGVGGMQL